MSAPKTPWTRAEYDALERLIDAGCRYTAIAEQMGRTLNSVKGAAQRIGLQRKERTGWKRMPEERLARLHALIADCIEVRRMTCLDTTRYLNAIGEPVSNAWVHRQIGILGREYRRWAKENASRVKSLKTGVTRRAQEAKRRACA